MTDSMAYPKPVVLVVDDTPANLDVLNGMLRKDYKLRVALNGPKALELAKREPRPDIILLDIMMPEMSGYEVCERLKADSETASIPVIFLTAKTQVEDEQKGLALGAVDYITKPFHDDIVRARLSRHLASHQETRQLIVENRELRAGKPRRFTDFDERTLLTTIQSGEGHALEFKSTLRWNLHTDRPDKKIENACLKTVAGYLNTDGGVLLVGVNDDGEAIGLDKDGFKSQDKLLLHWSNLLRNALGAEFIGNIRSTLHIVGRQRVLVVECLPTKAAVFFTRDQDEVFYVRSSANTQALKPSEAMAYIGQHFSSASERGDGVGDAEAGAASEEPPSRHLATLLFTDIVNSTQKAVELRDRGWARLLEKHHALVRERLAQYDGLEIDTAGDGFLATFDSPARAVQCAQALVKDVRELGVEIRAGVHTGECERVGRYIRGVAVHAGSRVMSLAGNSEVFVSGTVAQLAAGSEIRFTACGTHELKGLPGTWEIYRAESI